MQYIDLSFIGRPNPDASTRFYAMAGGGFYYRKVEITRFEGTASGITCDPWFWYCFPVSVPIESILGSRSGWDGGIDVGLGLEFEVGDESHFLVEARYHYIFGQSFDTPDGPRKANGQYMPIAIGIRF